MNNTYLIILFILAIFSFSTYSEKAFSVPANEQKLIAAIRAESNRAIEQRDISTIVSSLAPDYQVITGGGKLDHNNTLVEAASWAAEFEESDITYVRTAELIEVSSYIPRAFENGRWIGTYTTPRGRKGIGGSYSASWSKLEGVWKIRSEIYVTLYCKASDC